MSDEKDRTATDDQKEKTEGDSARLNEELTGEQNETEAEIVATAVEIETDEAAAREEEAKEETPQSIPAEEPVSLGAAEPAHATLIPGGMVGLIILLLVASTVGGLIVSLWPGMGPERPGLNVSTDIAGRLSAFDKKLTSLQDRVEDAEKSSKELEDLIRATGKGNVSAQSVTILKDMKDRIEALENTVAELQQNGPPAGASAGGADLAAIREQFNALSSNLTNRLQQLENSAPPPNLEQQLQDLAPSSEVDDLSDRVAKLEADRSGVDAKRAALALAVANLTRAIQNGQPFAGELQALPLIAPGITLPADIKTFAQSGVPSETALIDNFGDAAFVALKAEREKNGSSWVDQLQSNFDSVFSIRKKGDLKGDDTEAVLARAEVQLDNKNVTGALEELNKLQGPAADAMAAWKNQAAARVNTDAFLSRLNQTVVEQLADDGSND